MHVVQYNMFMIKERFWLLQIHYVAELKQLIRGIGGESSNKLKLNYVLQTIKHIPPQLCYAVNWALEKPCCGTAPQQIQDVTPKLIQRRRV